MSAVCLGVKLGLSHESEKVRRGCSRTGCWARQVKAKLHDEELKNLC
jgi:hypothetical protein